MSLLCGARRGYAPADRGLCVHEPAQLSGHGNGDWLVRVVPNKYPAFRPRGEIDGEPERALRRLRCRRGTRGHCRITAPRRQSVATERRRSHAGCCRPTATACVAAQTSMSYRYALVFKNVGPQAGASLEHSHSQLVATPMVPTEVAREILAAAAAVTSSIRTVSSAA